MKKTLLIATTMAMIASCGSDKEPVEKEKAADFEWMTEQFADIKILRYQVPGWEELTAQQRMLVYHLNEAGLAGRDIMWDQNYRHNLSIRWALEGIIQRYSGDKNADEWNQFMTYAKRVFFSNGIHHHYSHAKFTPEFSKDYFVTLLQNSETELADEVIEVMFNPAIDAKKVNKADGADLLITSAINFYGPDVTQAEAEAFYKKIIDKNDTEPISYGLNSTLVRNEQGFLYEDVWYVDGKYGSAITKMAHHLSEAIKYAENEAQAKALALLVEYYKTGDLRIWDAYNIAWVAATDGDVDYINGFVEVYNDPLGFRGSFENIVQIKDFEATRKMEVVSQNIAWFEANSPIMDEHKKKDVKGVTYKMMTVAGEAGDASPSTPIGVNLPNANWIRANYGSKSVSLANLEHAYDMAGGKGILEEFTFTTEERERAEKYSSLGSMMHTALHEVVGHASGVINTGVGTPKETLKNYASTLEEARADLVALYYIMDPKMVELGLLENDEAAKAEYEGYIRNGMMLQLRRVLPGEVIEEDHMRNRQLVAAWAYEQGMADNVIEKKVVNGKTYFVVNDFAKLRELFGVLLREIQRIKSEGDFEAGRLLVETYGVKVDPVLHAEVLERSKKLNLAPYSGFINPVITPVMKDGVMVDAEMSFPTDFLGQMLYYGENYSFLKK
jgi:dipeptidyl-peptidase III